MHFLHYMRSLDPSWRCISPSYGATSNLPLPFISSNPRAPSATTSVLLLFGANSAQQLQKRDLEGPRAGGHGHGHGAHPQPLRSIRGAPKQERVPINNKSLQIFCPVFCSLLETPENKYVTVYMRKKKRFKLLSSF